MRKTYSGRSCRARNRQKSFVDDKLDSLHALRRDPVHRRQVLASESGQLATPSLVGHLHGEHTIFKANCPRAIGYGAPASHRPGQKNAFFRRNSAQHLIDSSIETGAGSFHL
jgi:hypothetical protein